MFQGMITRDLKMTKKDIYKKLLTRQDFESKITKLVNSKPSQSPTICAELCEMFNALDIPCEYGKDADYYKSLAAESKLPEFCDTENAILRIMYNNFENYPTPSEYMQRIVDRLLKPEDEWQDNSLRLKILKQFIKYLNCCVYKSADGRKKSVYGWDTVIKAYAKNHGAKKLKSISEAVGYIDEGIFEEYLSEVKKLQVKLNQCQQEDKLLQLRETISDLKKQKKQNKGNDEELQKIEEELNNESEELKEATNTAAKAKENLKNARKKYGLVRLADDLSKGIFKTGGITKRDLYLFAIAFNMSYSSGSDENSSQTTNIFDYERDIEKNLFEDYYTNNLMRFVTEAYEGNLSAYDLDPYGRGINYKNYAEMVYIYFISKNYEPLEKFRKANEMIERLKNTAKPQMFADKATNSYQLLFTDTLIRMDEAKFEQFIASNYDCTAAVSVFESQLTQNTAFRIYNELIAQMEKDSPDDPAFLRENCNYGLFFIDVSALKKYETTDLENTLKINSENDIQTNQDEKIKKFFKLLYGINMFLGGFFTESVSDLSYDKEHKQLSKQTIKKMTVEDSEKMTRTALITAYYYRYNQRCESRGVSKSFIDVMDDYMNQTTGLNSMLAASGYQPISDRNIFDLAVIFSSYAYLTL